MYTIRQVSDMLDIPAVTLRAWEVRHHAVEPARTSGGYRAYSEQDIADLQWLKRQTERDGLTISQAVAELRRQRSRQPGSAAPQHGAHLADCEQLRERLYDALAAFRSDEAKTLADLGFSMYGHDTMISRVFAPLLVQVGDRWESGEASVLQEHYMTQFVTQRCFAIYQVFPVDPQQPRALAICPSGERHQTGLLLFALFLRQKGMEVLYLGADTPSDGLEALIAEQRIGVVCLSLTLAELQQGALALVERLREAQPHLQFVLGGRGFAGVPAPYEAWTLEGQTEASAAQWERWYAALREHGRPDQAGMHGGERHG
ncbi:cobalamin B12-binding domain-containing protein [Paenibacillus sp. IB182496]|uniref:Cobalamin B12-binding domain-containing protein n=1 Tax=Paenibacillus sabuli TaxID=2772509 RepID=A0A927BXL8_9BACL|nr:cobalamin B12-binding domain-containing protein [Paenibacillus sabuli]MBD2848227.1 cobalamin B12-binding domain-containing protein [Paenibacillus sabuli]